MTGPINDARRQAVESRRQALLAEAAILHGDPAARSRLRLEAIAANIAEVDRLISEIEEEKINA